MRLAASCTLLAAVIAPASLLVAALVNRGMGTQAIAAAAIACGVCWVAAALALSATFFGNQYQAPVQGVLGGMIFRMCLPLAAVVGLPKLGGEFEAPGMTTTILGVYLVALVVETALALRMVPQHSSSQSAKATGV